MKVDWGDGSSSDPITSAGTLTKAYGAGGTYTVTVSPGTGCNSYPYLTAFGAPGPNPTQRSYNSRINTVTSFGDLGIRSLNDAFREATNLTTVPNTLPSSVISLEGAFLGATGFNADISGWLPEGNGVKYLHEMFEKATSFNQDISSWDVSQVVTMDEMFDGAGNPMAFNQDLSSWDFSGLDRNWLTEFNSDFGTSLTGNDIDPLNQFIQNAGLDRDNYSALLQRWAAQADSIPNNISPGEVLAAYFCNARDARATLVTKGWTFDDGGLYLDAPTLGAISTQSTSLSVAFTAPATCADEVTNYEYTTDGGSNWTAVSPPSTTSPVTVSDLSAGLPLNVGLRAVASISGAASAFEAVTIPSQTLQNGSFESGLSNWTSYGTEASYTTYNPGSPKTIDLGGDLNSGVNLTVGQCQITDTTDYVTISSRRGSSQRERTSPDASSTDTGLTSSSPTQYPTKDAIPWKYEATVGTVTSIDDGPAVQGNALKLFSNVSTKKGWDVVHGPAVASDGFSANQGDVITLDWFAVDDGDDFAVLGILLDTSDCSQTEVIDATGTDVQNMSLVSQGSGWQNARVEIPATRTDNSYRFVFVHGTFDQSGGLAAGAGMYIDNISAGQAQTISFAAQSGRGLGENPTLSATTSSGLAVAWASNTTSVCTIDSATGETTFLSGGTCSITASQPGGTSSGVLYAAAASVTRSFQVADTRLTSLIGTTSDLGSGFTASPNATSYAVAVPTETTTYAITPTATSGSATIQVNGVAVSSGQETSPISLNVGANTIAVVVTVGSTSTTTTITVTRAAPPSTATPERRPREVVAPPVTPPAPATFRIPAPPTQFNNPTPPPVQGPVLRGQTLTPPVNPLATVNGVPTPTNTAAIGTTGVRVTTGSVDVGVRVQNETAGRVTPNQSGAPELSVVRNQSTILSGQGVLPGSTVQVFMAFGEQSAELARIPVDANGTFNGQAALQTPGSNAPLPIGRHVLQVVSVDQQGNQTVVDMPINVAQPSPQPEIILANGETPALPPGQSLATRAGEPVNVNVIPIPDNKQTVIDGGDWTMSIIAQGDGSNVVETDDGNVLVEFIRDESAEISGSGFMPLTRADVWLFSEPTLLGTVDIDENGEFNGTVNVDGRVVAVGEHTLQLQGVGEDGYVRAANLGVVVNDADGATPTTEQASITWIWWLVALLALAIAIAIWYWRRQQEAQG